jgi:hypothetical protein
LGKHHGQPRLEAACERALTFNALSYTSVKSILDTGLEKLNHLKEETKQLKIIHSNIRGANYFKEQTNVDTSNTTKSESDETLWNG